jgi:GNAT superfamily N-acetyltransferase
MKIIRISFDTLDKNMMRSLRAATFGPGRGEMYRCSYHNPDTYIAMDGETILGWSIITRHFIPGDDEKTGMFFVKSEHRRRGIGGALYLEMKKHHRDFRVERWDPAAKDFFDFMEDKYATLLV